MKKKDMLFNELFGIIIGLACQSRREGILALENPISDMDNWKSLRKYKKDAYAISLIEMLKKGLIMVVDGVDRHYIERFLHNYASSKFLFLTSEVKLVAHGVLSIQEGVNPKIAAMVLGALASNERVLSQKDIDGMLATCY